jgi:MoxR-like ATPase
MPADATQSTDAPAALAAGAVPADLTERLQKLRDVLLTGLVERDVAIRLALLGALAGEHLLMVGPPGTAKSMVARRLQLAFREASYFERLLTRFTVPEELFGPLSIKGLEEDRYERLTARYLPTASIAFLDEIFKANSAILNALLTLLNEREFDNGTRRDRTPLISVVGASNELGEGEELDALFDRFLLRLHVGPVSRGAFLGLLGLRGHLTPAVPEALKLTVGDLVAVQVAADAVEVPDDVQVLLCELRDWSTAEEIAVSDRRWRKLVKLLQVAALTNGRKKVSIWDCWLLQHCLWDTPDDREKVYDWYAARVGTSAGMDPSRLTKIVVSWEAKLHADQESRSQMRDAQSRLVYKGADGKPTLNTNGRFQGKRGADPLYLAPPNSQDAHRRPLADRTNGGKGYTLAELATFLISDPFHRAQYFQHWTDQPTYLANQANWHVVELEFPALMEPTRHKEVYVDSCLREVDALKSDVTTYKAQLHQHIQAMEKDIRDHLWVTPDFAQPASDTLKATRQEVETLLARVDKVRKGFELLPRDLGPEAPAKTPARKK